MGTVREVGIVIEGLRKEEILADTCGVEEYIALCREIKEME